MTCSSGYLNGMADQLAGNMGFVFSNFRQDGDWSWLQGSCPANCWNDPNFIMTNIKVATSGAQPIAPVDPINLNDYDFGDACGSKDADDCGVMNCPSIDHCKWSWRKDDPAKYSGNTAKCRCDEIVSSNKAAFNKSTLWNNLIWVNLTILNLTISTKFFV